MTNSSSTEKNLVQRLKAGDLQALNSLMDRYKEGFYRLAYRILGNTEDAEEALQDTFLRAYQKIGSFEGNSQLSTWLYRICVNQCLNKREGRKKLTLRRTLPPTGEMQNLPASQDLETDYIRTEMQQQVVRAVMMLKPEQRALIALYYVQGFSCSEISEILQKPIGTIKTHLFRARKNLKKILADYQFDQER